VRKEGEDPNFKAVPKGKIKGEGKGIRFLLQGNLSSGYPKMTIKRWNGPQ
jgi:hypothetical protein